MLNRLSLKEAALRGLDQLPAFSPVLNHLMSSLADEDVSFAQLATVIERDSVLSGNVLRLVNSALYGRRGTISSVRAAVSILGLGRLRNFLLGLSVTRLFARLKPAASFDMARFNNHSTVVAILADLIVQKASTSYPEGAFAAGLLHDLGRLMVAITLPGEHMQIAQLRAESGRPLEECEQAVLETTHAELSAVALQRWGLPTPIQKAVLYHHSSAHDPAAAQGNAVQLSAVIETADRIADALDHSIDPIETTLAPELGESFARLRLEPSAEAILRSLETELQAVRATA
jgi:HD-like signal output (HDOD) protein